MLLRRVARGAGGTGSAFSRAIAARQSSAALSDMGLLMLFDVRRARSHRSSSIRVASVACAITVCWANLAAAGEAAKNTDALTRFSQSVESLVQRTAPS